jgi:ribosomal protein S18 acetylase RimI-like enzyme
MGECYSGISSAEEKIEFMKHYLTGIAVWAAWDGDQLAGFLSGKISGDRLVLYDILIDPAYQRRGIARTLLQMAIEESGAHEINAEVNRANTASQALFQSLAFECKVTSDWLVLKRP